MKKHGILNSHIAKVLADLGHTDRIAIADIGLPIPEHIEKIDLALNYGVPSFKDVLHFVAQDMVIEAIIVADELEQNNINTYQLFKNEYRHIELQKVSHDQLKQLTNQVKVVIRTGEATPYANCILQAGVNFGT